MIVNLTQCFYRPTANFKERYKCFAGAPKIHLKMYERVIVILDKYKLFNNQVLLPQAAVLYTDHMIAIMLCASQDCGVGRLRSDSDS